MSHLRMRRGALTRAAALFLGVLAAPIVISISLAQNQVASTTNDYFQPGTQPLTLITDIADSGSCRFCHGNFDVVTEPHRQWAASMMGQAARDPVFHAGLAIANQDAAFAGDLCLRCHAPGGWVSGRSEPTDGSALEGPDLLGVNCQICHRMVDPIYKPGVSPMEDQDVLAALSSAPTEPHNGEMVIDFYDRRRGPYELQDFFIHEWFQSPFHRDAAMCGTCHDVSNPLYEKQLDGSYALTDLDTAHPTQLKADEFPLERTYGEWSRSEFAAGPVDVGGRFGGNKPAVSSCQDCHMPATDGFGCFFGQERTDLGRHTFNGGNTWVLGAVRNLYDDSETFLTPETVADSEARAVEMLQLASDMTVFVESGNLRVRVTNESGHKLPTGYPEGRRMWLNVRFFDSGDALIAERGTYDPFSAALTVADTKVYEAKLGIDAAVAALVGLPAGESFHFALNNMWLKDNRIPPRGFTNAGFAAVQAAPVGYAYADGQNWDDTLFAIPSGAARAEVRLFYQTASREYIEFLRDANTTDDTGQTAYDQWVATGMSAPVEMDFAEIVTPPSCPNPHPACTNSDIFPSGGDCQVNLSDLGVVLANFAPGVGGKSRDQGDLFPLAGGDGFVDLSDLGQILADYGADCR